MKQESGKLMLNVVFFENCQIINAFRIQKISGRETMDVLLINKIIATLLTGLTLTITS